MNKKYIDKLTEDELQDAILAHLNNQYYECEEEMLDDYLEMAKYWESYFQQLNKKKEGKGND